MGFDIDINDGHGLSSEAHHLVVEEEQGNAVFVIHFTVKAL